MELLLNTFWLLIAVGALGVWIHQSWRGARRMDLRLQLCALGCVLVLLFSAISATDDLHATALAVETSDFSRKMLKSITPTGASAHTWQHAIPAMLSLALLFSAAARRVDIATQQLVLLTVTGFIHQVDGRAPPSAFLLA
jgi:hypothetical protein